MLPHENALDGLAQDGFAGIGHVDGSQMPERFGLVFRLFGLHPGRDLVAVEDVAHGGDFGSGVFQRTGFQQVGELLAVGGRSGFEGFQDEQGLFVLQNIAADLLAEGGRVAVGVQVIVLNLERDARQPTEMVQMFGIGLRRTGANRAHFERGTEQHGGFQFNHANVFGDGHISAGLEIHVHLLAFAHLDGRAVEHIQQRRNRLCISGLRQKTVGMDEHHIAAEDARVHVVFRVDGRLAPAQRRGIHDVVVHEREIVEQLDGSGGGQGGIQVVGEKLVAEQQQRGPDALAAEPQDVRTGFVQFAGRGGEGILCEELTDAVEERGQFVHGGRVGTEPGKGRFCGGVFLRLSFSITAARGAMIRP